MKSFVIPVSIIVGLIAFFVIIDHKEFKRFDDNLTNQIERHESKGRPVSISADVRRVGMNSMAEAKTNVSTGV